MLLLGPFHMLVKRQRLDIGSNVDEIAASCAKEPLFLPPQLPAEQCSVVASAPLIKPSSPAADAAAYAYHHGAFQPAQAAAAAARPQGLQALSQK
jgi:hypothetical protein